MVKITSQDGLKVLEFTENYSVWQYEQIYKYWGTCAYNDEYSNRLRWKMHYWDGHNIGSNTVSITPTYKGYNRAGTLVSSAYTDQDFTFKVHVTSPCIQANLTTVTVNNLVTDERCVN